MYRDMVRILFIAVFMFFLFTPSLLFAAEKVYFYHTDAEGTPVAMTDASGNVVWQADYKPFGEEQSVTPTPENKKKFIGKEKDEETGLYYFGARYMDAGIGRFTTPDPAGISESDLLNPQRLNRYNYSLNNPYRYLDPDGRYERDVHFTLTKYLAIKAGFTPEQAFQIASANQGTDESKVTGPFVSVQARQDYHFVSGERLAQMYEQAYKTGDLTLIGQFLHAWQDSYSHAGFEPNIGHLFKGHEPDKTYNDSEKANIMAEGTYEHMLIFLKNAPDNWDEFRNTIDQFNRAKTIEDKEKILSE